MFLLFLFVPTLGSQTFRKCLKRMAGTTRLELATSAVTGQRSNQLNYVPTRQTTTLPENLAGQGFASFAYSALFDANAYNGSCSCQTADKLPRAVRTIS